LQVLPAWTDIKKDVQEAQTPRPLSPLPGSATSVGSNGSDGSDGSGSGGSGKLGKGLLRRQASAGRSGEGSGGSPGLRQTRLFKDDDLKDLQLLRVLGQGSFGVVHEGAWRMGRGTERRVAVKHLKLSRDEDTPGVRELYKELVRPLPPPRQPYLSTLSR
jgi:hypothetical protein